MKEKELAGHPLLDHIPCSARYPSPAKNLFFHSTGDYQKVESGIIEIPTSCMLSRRYYH